ncbi:MAG: hypothetical protein PSV23_16670 [Brevundimonas sp.]|uniref:hypothetical protein n=1 Tax=Brevundimonas sp. TaxID=1871086 RepID=UPI00248A2200|nr:hypothetical protein [Brevundimonas sp.]MDI1328425.1 hypothetical protein [Brevundimonas sp.]
MRIQIVLAGVAAAAVMAFPALAQEGQYGEQLNRIVTEAAAGTCLEALMAPSLLDACNGQIQGMAPALSAMGAIESMTFVSAQDTPGGRVETWAVKFAGGQTLSWVIGHQQDGKFSTVGTAG